MAVLEFPASSWMRGINSVDEPTSIADSQYQWGENILCKGGMIQTRPSLVRLPAAPVNLYPRGFTIFKPNNKNPIIVAAFGGRIYQLVHPFDGDWALVTTLWTLDPSDTPIIFETCVKGAVTNSDGTLSIIDPYPILIIQNGNGRAIAWDGINPPTSLAESQNQTPRGTWMKWIANRLWVATGNKLRVSNILDPLTFTEEDLLAEGGYFTLPDECTGLGVTADQQSLLAFTATTTTAFQAGIRERATWKDTTNFQKIILPNIGCVAGNTIVSQYGILWWLAQGGLMRLDTALQSYRTSEIRYLDNNMARSKGNLSPDISRSCAGWWGNYLVLSVPSGDLANAHTWVMDQSVKQLVDESSTPVWASVWTGIRPVQWVTANINGQSRCFAFSLDKPFPNTTNLLTPGMWEAFCGARKDLGMTVGEVVTPKAIESSVEFKYLGYSEVYKDFSYAVLELAEMSGSIHLEIFYASRHSGYERVLEKDIVATTDSLFVNVPITTVDTYLKQRRTVTTFGDTAELADADSAVESKLVKNTDKAFSILVKWTGAMTITKMKLCATEGKYHVESEEDETTQRYIKADGTGAIIDNAPIDSVITHGHTSTQIVPVSSRWEEGNYSANT